MDFHRYRTWLLRTIQRIAPRTFQHGIPGQLLSTSPYKILAHLMRDLHIQNPIVFDIGAHEGQTVLQFRHRLPGAHIYCFEPFPPSVQTLHHNLQHDPNIEIVPKAVAHKCSQTQRFYVNHRSDTNSLLPRPSEGRRYYPADAGHKSIITVPTITIDSFLEQAAIDSVSILKLDIQGGELDALRGADACLKRGSVPAIYLEVMFVPHYQGGPMYHHIASHLSDRGYTLYKLFNLTHGANGQIRYGDALFVSPTAREEVINAWHE